MAQMVGGGFGGGRRSKKGAITSGQHAYRGPAASFAMPASTASHSMFASPSAPSSMPRPGGGGGAQAAPPPRPAAQPSSSGSGELKMEGKEDPRLARHADRIESRLDDGDFGASEAADFAGGKIRDAGVGRRRAMRTQHAKRGVLGATGVPGLSEGADFDREGREIAESSTKIGIQRERDKDAFTLGSTGALGAPGETAAQGGRDAASVWGMQQANARADRAMDLQTWMATEQNQRMRERNNLDNFVTQMELLSAAGRL